MSEKQYQATPNLQIGTSGWVYKHWMGIFYQYGSVKVEKLISDVKVGSFNPFSSTSVF